MRVDRAEFFRPLLIAWLFPKVSQTKPPLFYFIMPGL